MGNQWTSNQPADAQSIIGKEALDGKQPMDEHPMDRQLMDEQPMDQQHMNEYINSYLRRPASSTGERIVYKTNKVGAG